MSHEPPDPFTEGMKANLAAAQAAAESAKADRDRYKATAHEQEAKIADLHKMLAEGSALVESQRAEIETLTKAHADTAEFRTRIEVLEANLRESEARAEAMVREIGVERDRYLEAKERLEHAALPVSAQSTALARKLAQAAKALCAVADSNPDLPLAEVVASMQPQLAEAFAAIKQAARWLPVPDGAIENAGELGDLGEILGEFADSEAKREIAELRQKCKQMEDEALARPFTQPRVVTTLTPPHGSIDRAVEPMIRALDIEKAKVEALLSALERVALGYGNAGRF
jgi:hypothetical protein